MDTFGNCQRPAFSLGLSQHMHKNNKPVKNIGLTLEENNERNKQDSAEVFQYLSEKLPLSQTPKRYYFIQCLDKQQLSIARCKDKLLW